MSQASEVIIVGAGVIGNTLAWELTRQGMAVQVLDAGFQGQASRVAAGMWAPSAEAGDRGELWLALHHGLERSLAVLPALESESGMHVGWMQSGVLQVADTEAMLARLNRRYQWLHPVDPEVSWLDGQAAREIEPHLSPDIAAALYAPGEGHVMAGDFTQAAARAAIRRGARFEDETVVGLIREGHRVTGVETTRGPRFAGDVVVAAGSWTAPLLRELPIGVKISPIRGQLLLLKDNHARFRHIIFGDGIYVTPKPDGHLLLGATEDDAGYDARLQTGAVASILSRAPRIAASLADTEFVGGAAGLRPQSSNGHPVVGPHPDWEHLWMATGHFRNGILLAVLTAERLAQAVAQGSRSDLWQEFMGTMV